MRVAYIKIHATMYYIHADSKIKLVERIFFSFLSETTIIEKLVFVSLSTPLSELVQMSIENLVIQVAIVGLKL